jgi:phosphate transport system protein
VFPVAKTSQRQIEGLKQKLLTVGGLVETAIAGAIAALLEQDVALAGQVIDRDAEIDRLEVEVEEEVLAILALHHPVAADLRFVVAALKINSELERVGDLAKNIAKRVVQLQHCPKFDMRAELRDMATDAQRMVRLSLDAFVAGNPQLAQQVREADERVDAARRRLREEIEQRIAAQPDLVGCLMKYLSVCRHLERMADMATHIAEEVIYMSEGEIVRHHAAAPVNAPASGLSDSPLPVT